MNSEPTAAVAHTDSEQIGHAYENHVPIYWRVIIALSLLTLLEFGIAYLIDGVAPVIFMLGVLSLILLAVVKATMVARIFMHLKYDPKILSLLCILPVILGSPLVVFCIWDGLKGPSFG
jgi:caa(3)-type oxidase subunit IV